MMTLLVLADTICGHNDDVGGGSGIGVDVMLLQFDGTDGLQRSQRIAKEI